jgi:RNA polymerase sigma factor (sigma-70 family)
MLHNQLPDISYATGKHTPLANGAVPTDRELLARLAAGLDECAFATLVRRHGPLVMGICVRVLRNFHDAEDACQATFLVLLRKAGSIDRPELLGNWLYGVAFRTAQKLRTSNARRRNREEQASKRHEAATVVEGMDKDELTILDRELCQLPDKYRMPLVLCYLDGKTHHEVARDLGWPIGSVSARLARGLQMLRDRLTHCGTGVSIAVLHLLLTEQAHAAPRSNALEGLIKGMRAGTSIERLGSPVGRGLADEILQNMDRRRRQRRLALWTVVGIILTALLMEGAALGGLLDSSPSPSPVIQQNPQSETPSSTGHTCGSRVSE